MSENGLSKKQQTRDRILSAAWRLFESEGYTQTSTRDIAQAASVAAGTVFTHFPTKLTLLKEGFQAKLDQVLLQASQLDDNTEPKQKLVHYARFLYAFYLQNLEFSREIFKTVIFDWTELEEELLAFQHALFSHQDYCATAASVMMDLYFMTLLDGLNARETDANVLVDVLERKLAMITLNSPCSEHDKK